MADISEIVQNNSTGVTVIIDGNSVAYRAFFKAPPLMADGTPTGVIHVFLSVLNKLINTPGVGKVITVFDAKGKNKRHELSAEYKATREAMPEDLSVQMDALKEVVPYLGLPLYCVSGFEADDVIYTLTLKNPGNIWLVTKDKDLCQLIDDRIKVYDYQTDDLLDRHGVYAKFAVYPEMICDMLSLSGDASDNIPGVKGVGFKTAASLLEKYGSLDGVYEHVGEIKGKLQEKLINDKELAYLSRTLVSLIDIPDLEESVPAKDDVKYKAFLEKYRLKSHLQKLESSGEATERFAPAMAEVFVENSVLLEQGVVTAPLIIAAINGKIYAADDKYYAEYSGEMRAEYYFDIKSLVKAGVPVNGEPVDIMLASWLIDPDNGGLKQAKNEDDEGFISRIAANIDIVCGSLRDKSLERLYFDMELPVARILADAEMTGIAVDSAAIKAVAKVISAGVQKVLIRMHERAQADINPNSPKQLAEYLYGTLALAPSKRNKRGFSTDEDTLLDLRLTYPDHSGIIEDILRYRELNKLLSTYTINMLEFMAADGRIHTEFKQTGTATGRLSSTNPNLQNIPQRGEYATPLRSAFIAKEGYSFASFDYSQIELRVLAHMSGDENLIKSFLDNIDIHSSTARSIFHLSADDDVSSDHRRIAKAVNFGILYGLSAFGLARDTKVPVGEAKVFIERYFSLYPSVHMFIDSIIEKTRNAGYCETISGRKRFIADISSRNGNIRQRAERMAINAPIQGSAADIIKLAMIHADIYIKENGIDAKLILQIHDELVFEVSDSELDRFTSGIYEVMKSVVALKVPLDVSFSTGKNWGEL